MFELINNNFILMIFFDIKNKYNINTNLKNVGNNEK